MVQKRAHVFLPEGLLIDIDQLFGKGKRSAFLTDIVEREIRRQKLLRALADARGCWKEEDHPELKAGSAAWVNGFALTATSACQKTADVPLTPRYQRHHRRT